MKQNNQLKRQLFLYAAFVFLQSLLFFGGVMVPFLTDWGGISFTQMMFLQAWFSFWLFIAEMPTGAVADFLGRKYSLMLSGLFGGLSMLVYSAQPAIANFLLAEFLFAIAMSLSSGANEALLYDSLKQHGKQRMAKKMIGLAHSVHLLAMLIASPVGSVMAKKWGLDCPVVFSALPIFLSVLAAVFLKEPPKFEEQSESLRYWQILKQGSLFFFKHKKLLAMVLEGVVVASAANFIIWLNQPLLAEAGLDVVYFGLVNAVTIGAEIAVTSHFEWFEQILAKIPMPQLFFKRPFKSSVHSSNNSRHQNRMRTLSYQDFSFWMVILAFFLALVSRSIWLLLLFAVLAGGFGYTRITYLSANLHEYIPSNKRATVISSLSMFRRFFQLILNPLVGLLMDVKLRLAVLFILIYLLVSKLLIKIWASKQSFDQLP